MHVLYGLFLRCSVTRSSQNRSTIFADCVYTVQYTYIYIYIYTYVRVWSVSCTCPAPIAYSSLPSIPMKYPKGDCDRIQFGKEVYILRVFYLVESLCFEEIEIVITVSERERERFLGIYYFFGIQFKSFLQSRTAQLRRGFLFRNQYLIYKYIYYVYIYIYRFARAFYCITNQKKKHTKNKQNQCRCRCCFLTILLLHEQLCRI